MTSVDERIPNWSDPYWDDIVARYLAGESGPKIAESIKVNRSTVWRVLRRRGARIRTNAEAQTKHTLRHDAFDVLSPDAAYWCGFLFTDGSISHRVGETPEVAVGISAGDRGHLVKLRSFVGSSHAITECGARQSMGYVSRPYCRFTVRSRRMADRLCALGRYEGPIDPALAQSRDFWRGAVDGDGSIGISCDYAYLKLVGSFRLLTAFVGFLGYTGVRQLSVRPTRSIFVVSSSGKTAERIIERIYGGATVALDRKADSADAVARWAVRNS